MKKLALIFALSVPTAALAQQQPDLALLQQNLTMTRNDRNQVLDALTDALARNQIMVGDLAKAQARIRELEEKYEPAKPGDNSQK